MQIQFGVEHSPHRSKVVSACKMINCYLEESPKASKSPVAVVPSYGLETFATIGTRLRGGTVVNGVPYLASGSGLYRLNATGNTTSLGSGLPGYGPVSVVGDGTNIVVVDSGDGYVYNGTTLSEISDPDFPGSNWAAYLDGYIVISEPDTGRVYVAGPLTPSSWNALEFASAEGAPDDVLYGIVEKRELFLFGRESIEVWINTGNADFPLERVGSGFIEMGIKSDFAATKADNSVCFVGTDNMVYRLEGYTPRRISTHVVEQDIESGGDIDVRLFWWVEGGHRMLCVQSSAYSWVFDFATQLWHTRQSFGTDTWDAEFAIHAFGRYFAASGNQLGVFTPDVFTEFGETMRLECDSAEVFDEGREIDHDCLELHFDVGHGLASGQGSDPKVMFQFSDDSGHSWSNEKWRSLGRMGEYKNRVRLLRAGRSRRRVYKYVVSDPVRRTMVGAYLNP
jgi:hypothetical protein